VNTPLPPSARELDTSEVELVEIVRQTIDATTDAGPGEDGIHTWGRRCGRQTVRSTPALTFTIETPRGFLITQRSQVQILPRYQAKRSWSLAPWSFLSVFGPPLTSV
jgi:hypothetical protein